MGPAIHFENVVVKVFNPETEARHSDFTKGLQFLFREGAWLALKGDFLGLVPGEKIFHPISQVLELTDREITGCSPAKIDELRLPPGEIFGARIAFKLLDAGIEIGIDLVRILVGVDAEITEVTAFSAKRDVKVDS